MYTLCAGVEQVMKNWEGEKFRTWSARKCLQLPPLFQFAPPPTYWRHMPFFAVQFRSYACCDHNECESYRPIIICRHCWPAERFVSFHWISVGRYHKEWSHWKVGRQIPVLAPLHRNLEGHSPSLPYRLFHPWLCATGCRIVERNYYFYLFIYLLTKRYIHIAMYKESRTTRHR